MNSYFSVKLENSLVGVHCQKTLHAPIVIYPFSSKPLAAFFMCMAEMSDHYLCHYILLSDVCSFTFYFSQVMSVDLVFLFIMYLTVDCPVCWLQCCCRIIFINYVVAIQVRQCLFESSLVYRLAFIESVIMAERYNVLTSFCLLPMLWFF
jgi:hypothetical protein